MCLMRLLEEMHSVSGHQIQRDEKVMPNINPSHKYTLFLVFIHPSNNLYILSVETGFIILYRGYV